MAMLLAILAGPIQTNLSLLLPETIQQVSGSKFLLLSYRRDYLTSGQEHLKPLQPQQHITVYGTHTQISQLNPQPWEWTCSAHSACSETGPDLEGFQGEGIYPSLGNLLQCFTTITVKNFFLISKSTLFWFKTITPCSIATGSVRGSILE